MAGEAFFVGWGQIVRGREQLALGVFMEALAYYAGLQEEGRIESFEPILLAPHGGDLAGFIIVRGEQSSLDSVRASADFLRLMARTGAIVDNLGVASAYTGEALGELMAVFGQISEGLPQAQ